MMIVRTRAMLAAPFMAMAVVASSPVGSFAAVLDPFPPRGSGLLARQSGEVQIPPQCDSQCVPIVNTINVSTHTHTHTPSWHAPEYAESSTTFSNSLELPHGGMRLYDSEHERVIRLRGVRRLGRSYPTSSQPRVAIQLSYFHFRVSFSHLRPVFPHDLSTCRRDSYLGPPSDFALAQVSRKIVHRVESRLTCPL
jgi:hypothetical protein